MPYISASIFQQIAQAVVPQVDKMSKDEEGPEKDQPVVALRDGGCSPPCRRGASRSSPSRCQGAVANPGFAFRVQMAFFLTTGAIFVMWLGEQITERGIGNGASLMIFFSIVERIWPSIFSAFGYVSTGAIGAFSLLVLIIIMVGVVAAVVAVTMAARARADPDPAAHDGARAACARRARSFIPLRINSSGVMPIVFAQSVIVVPGAFAQFMGSPRLRDFADMLAPGTTLYYILSAILILFFTYFYTSIIFNPIDVAENLKKQGGFIPGVKPGAKTAEYIDDVVSKITLPGALFLTVVALLPIWISDGDERAVQLRRNVAADRRRRRARHDHADEPAPAAAEVRRLHEEGAGQVPRTTGSAGRVLARSRRRSGPGCTWPGPFLVGHRNCSTQRRRDAETDKTVQRPLTMRLIPSR